MIISPGRGYIFVHIPKTGGTAMALALEARAMADDILIGDTPKARRRKRRLEGLNARGRLWKHSTLADISGLISEAEIAEMFTFTLVRNPWDRMVSYYHWLRVQRFDHPAVQLSRDLPFGEFLAHPHTGASLQQGPYGSYMRRADGVEHCAAFVRLEALEQDLAPVRRHLGFPLSLPAGVNASTRRGDYRGYYDDKSAELVARLCASDIARFGYRFDQAA
ncbi:MAG: sulfotransferase family 2 domain-containing protein [Celeribacter sp.]|jgi:hypothetical protein